MTDRDAIASYADGFAAGVNVNELPIYAPQLQCPYDGRTRLGRAWWSGFLSGDMNRPSHKRQL